MIAKNSIVFIAGVAWLGVVRTDHHPGNAVENPASAGPTDQHGSQSPGEYLEHQDDHQILLHLDPHECRSLTPEEKSFLPSIISCCNMISTSDRSKIGEAFEICSQELHLERMNSVLLKDGNPTNPEKAYGCLVECVLHKLELMDEHGRRLNLQNFKQFLITRFRGSPLEEIGAHATEHCLADPTLDSASEHEECYSGAAYHLSVCVVQRIFQHCPEQLWTPDKTCTWMRTRYEMCPHAFQEDWNS